MKWRVATLALLVGMAVSCCHYGKRNAAVGGGKIYVDANHGFELQIPEAWSFSKDVYPFHHYTVVFLTVANYRATAYYSLMDSLSPGRMGMVIGYFEFPDSAHHADDDVGNDLHLLLGKKRFEYSAGEEAMELSFHKWGHTWDINIYLAEPISPRMRREEMELIESFRFLSRPASDDETNSH